MVIKDKDREYMAAYSQVLLDCSANRRIIAACPLAFGETGVKERVKGVLNYRKPPFWVIIVAVIACIVVAVCFMINPAKRITLPDDPVVFSIHDNPDGYIEYHWEEKGLVYVPYMPLDPGLAGDCIGYDAFEGEFGSYVCKVEGLPETEWICDVSSDVVNGHTAGMIMKEINVKKVPDMFASGEKYDADAAYKAASDFVTNYNETLDAVNKTTNAAVSSAAGSMTRMTGVMTKSLGGIGISVGKDGRMSINEDEFKNAGLTR